MNLNHAIKNIAEQIADFVEDIVKEIGQEQNFSYRIDSDGKLFYFMLYNNKTHTTGGKCWSYKDITQLCLDRKVEFEFNRLVRELIVRTTDIITPLPQKTGKTLRVVFKDVLWIT